VAELVDALASGASVRKYVEVRIASGNSQGNVPMQAMLAVANFRGRGT